MRASRVALCLLLAGCQESCQEEREVVSQTWPAVRAQRDGELRRVFQGEVIVTHTPDGAFRLVRAGDNLLESPFWRFGIPDLTEEHAATYIWGVHALAGSLLDEWEGTAFAFGPDKDAPGRSRVMHAEFKGQGVPKIFAWPDGYLRHPTISVQQGEGTVTVDIRAPAAIVVFDKGAVTDVTLSGDREWLDKVMTAEPTRKGMFRVAAVTGNQVAFGEMTP